MGRQEEKSEQTKAKLLAAAHDLLVEEGYHRTSTAAVCRRAGIARGTMLHHYPNKDALVIAAMEDNMTRQATAFMKTIRFDKGTTIKEIIYDVFDVMCGRSFIAGIEIAIASRTEPALGKMYGVAMDRFEEQIAWIVKMTFPKWQVDYDKLRCVTGLVMRSLVGLAMDVVILNRSREDAQVYLDMLLHWIQLDNAEMGKGRGCK
ncbi:TetR/AcrR family transcriptional regulator [Veronia pacifica]|uniref:TetR/AcrR family transcriptional regulator n=1 Tax=Veronia pacifica TaxID=1080227 RepID=UPI0015869BA1|nr:TetR/AcrR family transcriptional regulator [Veronia pacifica]